MRKTTGPIQDSNNNMQLVFKPFSHQYKNVTEKLNDRMIKFDDGGERLKSHLLI